MPTKSLNEEMQGLCVADFLGPPTEYVKDSVFVTDFEVPGWDYHTKFGWAPKPLKENVDTKRKNGDLPQPAKLEWGFYYREETPRKNVPPNSPAGPELHNVLPAGAPPLLNGGVQALPVCGVDQTRGGGGSFPFSLGTLKRSTQEAYEPVQNLSVHVPRTSLSAKLGNEAQKLWKYSSEKREWTLLEL